MAAKQVVHEFDIPNLRLLNISANVGSLRNSPRWPQLRVLQLDGLVWEELIFQDIPIASMPCLESIAISPVLANDAFLNAVGCLCCLKKLYLESSSYRSYGDPSWSEQGVLRMLQDCGRLQYLRINYRELVSDIKFMFRSLNHLQLSGQNHLYFLIVLEHCFQLKLAFVASLVASLIRS
ncbi:hypothetical protein BJV82DRAFT_665557 [Fennellomyces sp. T-0311]|nr:hypothetical protein BJV82DRAFT_665557 [Fennellomyces sp. T-0311]